MRNLFLIATVLFVTACDTLSELRGPSCSEKVVIAEMGITEATEGTLGAVEAQMIDRATVQKILIGLDTANSLSDHALHMCGIDENKAENMLLQIESILVGINKLLEET